MKWKAVTGTVRRELLGERGGSEWACIGTVLTAGTAPQEPKQLTNVYVSSIYVGVREFLRREVGA